MSAANFYRPENHPQNRSEKDLSFDTPTRRVVKYDGASFYETVNQNNSTPETLTVHHLIPQWFAREYIAPGHLLNPAAFNFKDRFMSFFLGQPLQPFAACDWIRSKYNAILIDSISHQDVHNYDLEHHAEAMQVYRDLTLFFLGADAFLAEKWQTDFDQPPPLPPEKYSPFEHAKSIQRTIPHRIDSFRNFEPTAKLTNSKRAGVQKTRDRTARRLNQKLRRFITEHNAEKRYPAQT